MVSCKFTEDTEKKHLKKLVTALLLVCLCYGATAAAPVREFVDIRDYGKGYVHNFEEGASWVIPTRAHIVQ